MYNTSAWDGITYSSVTCACRSNTAMPLKCAVVHGVGQDMVKEGGGAVILRLTSAQYLSGIPAALSSESFRCLISSSFLRLQGMRHKSHDNYYSNCLEAKW